MDGTKLLPNDNGTYFNGSGPSERRKPIYLNNITVPGSHRDKEHGINGSIQNGNRNRGSQVRAPTIQSSESQFQEDVPLNSSPENTPKLLSPSSRPIPDAASMEAFQNSGVHHPFSMAYTPLPTRAFTPSHTKPPHRRAPTPEVHNMPDFHTYWGSTVTVETIRASPYYTRIPIPANTRHLETWRSNIDVDHPLYIAIPGKPPLFTVHAVHPIPVHVLRHMSNDHLQYMATFLDNEYYEMHCDCLRHKEGKYKDFVIPMAETQRRIADLCARRVETLMRGGPAWLTGLREIEGVWGRWRQVLDATEEARSEKRQSCMSSC